MHELAICQSLLSQVRQLAIKRRATAVHLIKVKTGPLSGVEAPLLLQAFSIARSGTIAETAELEIEVSPVVIRCRTCSSESVVQPNRLLCDCCGDWRVDITQGTDLVLMSVELSGLPGPAATERGRNEIREDAQNV